MSLAIEAFFDRLAVLHVGGVLGRAESLVAHPGEHDVDPRRHGGGARLRGRGLLAGLLRVSVGIEDGGDLVADLRAGLARAAAHATKAQQSPHLQRRVS